jgi:hypothetical protein
MPEKENNFILLNKTKRMSSTNFNLKLNTTYNVQNPCCKKFKHTNYINCWWPSSYRLDVKYYIIQL